MLELTAFDLPLSPAPDGGYATGHVLADRYELTRIIGRGGTAVVWVARDYVLAIDVAVKIVLPSRDDLSSGLRERTIQEARLCAQLTDPAVCRVIDFGFTQRDDPYVVSELLSGEPLDDRLVREGRLPAVEAVRLLLPILDALGAAHHRGIVHRDVKPANVFLASSDGRFQPKLLDFGIACSSDVRSRTTAAGAICGTPCYMSPEQARGSDDIDRRSDLWSFCVMLYEAVTGTAPFFNDNHNATLFAIASQTVPSLASFGCDEVLARIVERGMQKDRDARWASAEELADALAHWLAEQGIESDVCGISLRQRFLGRTEAAAPIPLDVVDEVSTERVMTFVPERRRGWSGTIPLLSAAVAVGVVAAAVIWIRQSALSGQAPATPAAAVTVVQPPPAPPVPVPESVRTDVAVRSPLRDKPGSGLRDDSSLGSVSTKAASTASATSPASVAKPRVRATPRPEPIPEPLEPPAPSFPPPSPFSPKLVPLGPEPDFVREAPPEERPIRAGRVPPRDFGI
jgi:serine/threonine-protein kinase